MLFSFKTSQADKLFNEKISQINILTEQLQKSSNTKQSEVVKQIFYIAFGRDKPNGLFQDLYKSTMTEKQVVWVPKMQTLYSIFSLVKDAKDRNLMTTLFQMKDLRIPLDKSSIPQYLIRNKLLKDRQSYSFISYSYQGYTVSLFDYMFMRLAWAISQTQFIQGQRDAESLYNTDDFYYYISRNPYLMHFFKFITYFESQKDEYKRMMNVMKLVLFQQALLKYKSNLSGNVSYSYKYKVKLNYLYVIFLMLRKGRDCFSQCELFLSTVINDFSNLIYAQNQSYLRTIIRVVLFAFNSNSIQCQVIDALQKANRTEGWFDLKHYNIKQFARTCRKLDKRSKASFLAIRSDLIKLFQKDVNYLSRGRVFNYSYLHNLSCFFKFQEESVEKNMLDSNEKNKQILRGKIIKSVIESFYYGVDVINKPTQSKDKINDETVKQMRFLIEEMNKHLMNYYDNQGIDFDKIKNNSSYRSSFKVQLNSFSSLTSEFKSSLRTHHNVKDRNCWEMPQKQSQFTILFNLFFFIANAIDIVIPGHKDRKYPLLNLRYFCNPISFMILVLFIGLFLKAIF